MSDNDYDVIVIGAGHNGLTAAAYLRRAGLRVIVLEASPTSGGMLGTNAIFDTAPDHLVNEGGIQASLFRSSTIEADLELKRHGLRQIIADPFHVHLDPDGPSLAFWKDPAKTAEEIKYFSQRDARKYLEFSRQLDAAMDLVMPFMNGHPTHPSGRAILGAIPVAARRRKDLQPLVQLLTRSHAELITEQFDTPLLRAALASMPPFCWMTQDGTGWALIYIGMCQRTNSARMAGGSGALPGSIQRSFEASGGTVRLSARVTELLLDAGRISGVRLDGGEVLHAPYVLASCSPKLTLCELLPRGVLDDTMQRRADAIPVDVVEAATLKIDVALDGQLTLPRHQAWRDDDLNLREPIVAWQTFDEHIRAWEDTIAGRWPDPICGIGIIPTALDPSQAPPGKDTFWYWSGITPPTRANHGKTCGRRSVTGRWARPPTSTRVWTRWSSSDGCSTSPIWPPGSTCRAATSTTSTPRACGSGRYARQRVSAATTPRCPGCSSAARARIRPGGSAVSPDSSRPSGCSRR